MSHSRDHLIPGTLNLLILKAVSTGPLHGYGISKWILDRTTDVLQVEEGVLYPALHRLEKAGCVEAEWGLSENNRRARYYTLTARGAQRFGEEEEAWRRYAEAVFRVLDPA